MRNSIKEKRSKKRLTQEELAKMAKISRPHLAEIENGNAIPSILVAQRIAKALKSKVDNIFLLILLFKNNKTYTLITRQRGRTSCL